MLLWHRPGNTCASNTQYKLSALYCQNWSALGYIQKKDLKFSAECFNLCTAGGPSFVVMACLFTSAFHLLILRLDCEYGFTWSPNCSYPCSLALVHFESFFCHSLWDSDSFWYLTYTVSSLFPCLVASVSSSALIPVITPSSCNLPNCWVYVWSEFQSF